MRARTILDPAWLALVVGVVGGALISLALGKDADWDLLNYHRYIPYAYLHGRMDFDVAPAQFQTYANPLGDLPFHWLTGHVRPRGVGLVLGAVHGLNFWFAWLLARRALGSGGVLTWACALTGALGAMSLTTFGAAFNDCLVSIPAIASLWLLVRGMKAEAPPGLPWIAAAGAVMGAGMGIKMTVAAYIFGVAAALLASDGSWRARLAATAAWGGGAAAGLALTGGAWMYKMYKEVGNPVFPFFNDIFRSPYYAVERFVHRFVPRTWVDVALSPIHIGTDATRFLELYSRDFRYAAVFALLVAVLVCDLALRLRRPAGEPAPTGEDPATRFLSTFFVASYAFWILLFAYLRYIVALEAAATILAVLLVRRLLGPGGRSTVAALVVLAAILATSARADYGHRPWSGPYFGVEAPALPRPPETIIVMVGGEPTAYVIPDFPESVRFVRIESNMTRPGDGTATQLRAERIIREHGGDLFVMFYREEELAVLSAVGLVPDPPGSDLFVKTGIDPDHALLRLRRLSKRPR